MTDIIPEIILSKIDEKEQKADFIAKGVKLNRFVITPEGVNQLFTPTDHPKSPGKYRYTAPFHIAKDAKGVNEFLAVVRNFLAIEKKIENSPATAGKLDFLMYDVSDNKVFFEDGDAEFTSTGKRKWNPETGKPYANNANTWIFKPYSQAADKSGKPRKKPEVFAKYAYKDGMTVPAGMRLVEGAKSKALLKDLSKNEITFNDIVNVQCQIYMAEGRVCCSFIAVQLVKQGERYGSQGADYDAFADFEDSEELPEIDFSGYGGTPEKPEDFDDVPDFTPTGKAPF